MSNPAHFVLGFIAGEGSFHVRLVVKQNEKVRPYPAFGLKVDEITILEKIRTEVGAGYITTNKDGHSTWQLQSEEDVLCLNDYVKRHKGDWFESTHKHEQFKKWSEVVELTKGKSNANMEKSDKKKIVEMSFSIANSDNGRAVTKKEWRQRIENE